MTLPARLGPYELGERIGAGGMGEVYRARDTRLGRDVAIKVLPRDVARDEEALARFEREARAVAALSHPNILALHDFDTQGGTAFAVMELLEGDTLRARMRAGAIPRRRAVEYALQIAQGLAAAHDKGITHRDIKPENVFVTFDDHVKILDFGLATDSSSRQSKDSAATAAEFQTASGVVLGTAAYMSPEQAQGRRVDHRSDIFSFGVVLYEMITGRSPFLADSSIDTLHHLIHDEPQAVTDLDPQAPAELQWLLRKCLAKEPDERYQSARELIVDLRALARRLDATAESSGVTRRSVGAPTSETPRHRTGRTLALLAAALVLVAAVWIWRSGAPSRPGTAKIPVTIERVTASGDVIDGAISPDGQYAAYVVSDSGQQALWVKQLKSGSTLQVVPSSARGFWGVTFAPDGGQLYYAIKGAEDPTGALYCVPVLGGTPRRLLSVIDSNISFSPDGKQLSFIRGEFPAASESAIMVANTDGSNQRMLVSRRAPEFFVPIFFTAPTWSPDGKLIVAPLGNRSPGDDFVLAAFRAADGVQQPFPSKRWKQLGQSNWLPDGHGLVVLASQTPRPAGALQVWRMSYPDGAAAQITNDLFDYRVISVTADGGQLLTVAADVTSSIWLAAVDGSTPPHRLTAEKYDGLSGVGFAEGGRILYRSLASGKADIWSMGKDGGEKTQLTFDGQNSWPLAMPGGRVVFVSDRGGPAAVWTMKLSGDGQRQVEGTTEAQSVAASRDWIVFTSLTGGLETLSKVPVNGGQPQRITDTSATRPAISPDGRQVAFFGRDPADGKMKLRVCSINGGAAITGFDISLNSYSTVRWSSDGRSLLHNSPIRDRSNIYRQPLTGGEPTAVTHFDDQMILTFDLSPDGTQLILTRGVLTRDAVIISNLR